MTPEDETETSAQGPSPAAYPGTGQQGAAAGRRPITDVTARVETIVTAAEDVARDIRAEAEADALVYAQRKRDEADQMAALHREQLAALRDSLTAQAGVVQRETQALTSQIQELMSRVGQVRQSVAAAAESAPVDVQPPAPPAAAAPVTPPTPNLEPPAAPAASPPAPAVEESPVADAPAETDRATAEQRPQDPGPTTPPISRGGPSPALQPQSYPPPAPPSPDVDAPEPLEPEPELEVEATEESKPRFSFRRSKSSAPEPDAEEAGQTTTAGTEPETTSELSEAAGAPSTDAAPRRDPDAAMLMATQMAVAGSSRSDIRTALLREFAPEDAERAVIEVLGSQDGE